MSPELEQADVSPELEHRVIYFILSKIPIQSFCLIIGRRFHPEAIQPHTQGRRHNAFHSSSEQLGSLSSSVLLAERISHGAGTLVLSGRAMRADDGVPADNPRSRATQ